MKKNNPRRYAVAGLGGWGIVDGLIFENWKEEQFDLDEIRKATGAVSAFGLDFGYTNDPSTLFCGILNKGQKKLYVFDEMYQTFSNARWTATTGDAYGTMNSFNNMNSSTKIDHVFYRGFPSCTKFVTVRQKWEGYQFISDHFPVTAEFTF